MPAREARQDTTAKQNPDPPQHITLRARDRYRDTNANGTMG